MTGSDSRGLILQSRDKRLLGELAIMRVVDREQAQTVAGFRSTSRANVRLLALTRAGLLRRFFFGSNSAGRKALYSLSAKGAHLIGSPVRGPRRKSGQLILADFFIEHQLTINEIYRALKFGPLSEGVTFKRWLPFFTSLTATRFIPDGYVELSNASGVMASFIEVDLGHESLTLWKQKVRQYLDYAVSGGYAREFGGNSFRVLVVANSERRLRTMRKTAASVTGKLFWFADLDEIRAKGLFAPIWHRAKNDDGNPAPLFP